MGHLKVLQVVGYKNSGKTTLLTQVIERLTKQHINVAVIKHHGHGGPLEQPVEQTDSMQYLSSGAVSSVVFDDSLIQLHMRQHENQLHKALELVKLSKPHIAFIEGMKAEHYPKLVLIRNLADWDELKTLSHIVAVITQGHISVDGLPSIERDNIEAIIDFLYRWMDGE